MRFVGQVIAFSGIIMFGGSLVPTGQALAFGQQWRPAPGFAPAQLSAYDRVANMPNFRPRGAARARIQQPFSRIQQRPYQQRAYQQRPYQQRPYQQRPYQQQIAAWQGYRAAPSNGAYNAALYPSQPGPMGAGYPAPGWAPHFNAMMQPWQQPVPMFARQFAWRPVGQPWIARSAPMQQRPRPQLRMAPQMVGFRPAGPAYAPAAGSWRPAAQPGPAISQQYTYQRYAPRSPFYTAGRQATFRSLRPAGYQMSGARVAGLNHLPVGATAGYWRPDSDSAAASSLHPSRPFRPVAYGRSLAGKATVAAGNREGLGFTQDNLPGWVTTYQETGRGGSCDWCSGS